MGEIADIEQPAIAFAESRGWWVVKFTSPGRRGVPDRVFIRNGLTMFIEFKDTGKSLEPQQVLRIKEMRDHGGIVYVVDTLAEARRILW